MGKSLLYGSPVALPAISHCEQEVCSILHLSRHQNRHFKSCGNRQVQTADVGPEQFAQPQVLVETIDHGARSKQGHAHRRITARITCDTGQSDA